MSAVHWSLPGQVAAGVGALAMGALGASYLVQSRHSFLGATRIAQGFVTAELAFPEKKTLSSQDMNWARGLNKERLKTAPLWCLTAIGLLVIGASSLRGAYLLSKAIYWKTGFPSMLSPIVFACGGVAMTFSSRLAGLYVANLSINAEQPSAAQRLA